MDSQLLYYLFCIVALTVGLLVIKKVVGCLMKAVVLVVLVLALAAIYYLYVS